MGSYVRSGSESPTPDELKKGYASPVIHGTPFAKFLFWTFAGLAASYAVTYGVVVALDKIQEKEDQRFAQMSTRALERRGIPVQPSPGHETLDWVDTYRMYEQHNKDLVAKGWDGKTTNVWKTAISDSVLKKTEAAIKQQSAGAAPAAGGAEGR